jgi:hypothetical protein
MNVPSNYFSPNYFVRDVVYSTSTLLLFLIGIIFVCGLSDQVRFYLNEIAGIKEFVTIFVAVLPGFILLAIVSGFISTGIFISIRDLYFKALRKNTYHQFDNIYSECSEDIKTLHRKYFKDLPFIKPKHQTEISAEVSNLLSLFNQINPAGYASVFRKHSLLAVYRQLSIYSLFLSFTALFKLHFLLTVIFLFLMLFFLHGNNRNVKQTVQMEFHFILGSAAKLELDRSASNDDSK